MSSESPPPAGPRVSTWLLYSLPAALFFCLAYFGMFSPLWGPPRPWKWLLAVSLLPALTLALDLRRLRPRGRGQGRPPGSRGAEARANWPWWRRVGAIYAGALLVFLGWFQSLGIVANVGAYPLISGLCLIMSLGIGIPLVVIAWPRERWRRSPTRRPPRARDRKVGSLLPGEEDTGKGTSIHVPTPSSGGYAGVWGGFGSKPAPKAWRPGRPSQAPTDEPVPRRFRDLRLLPRWGSRRTSAGSPLLTIAVTVIALVAAALITYGCVVA